jgi:hypothetical protein
LGSIEFRRERAAVNPGKCKRSWNCAEVGSKDGGDEFEFERAGSAILRRRLVGSAQYVTDGCTPAGLFATWRRGDSDGGNRCDSGRPEAALTLRIERGRESGVIKAGRSQGSRGRSIRPGEDGEEHVLRLDGARSARYGFIDRPPTDGAQLAGKRELSHCVA